MSQQENDAQTTVRAVTYSEMLDLADTAIITLAHSDRNKLEGMIPFLIKPDQMPEETCSVLNATTYGGQLADEIHCFENLFNNQGRIPRIMLAKGMVVEVALG